MDTKSVLTLSEKNKSENRFYGNFYLVAAQTLAVGSISELKGTCKKLIAKKTCCESQNPMESHVLLFQRICLCMFLSVCVSLYETDCIKASPLDDDTHCSSILEDSEKTASPFQQCQGACF